MEGVPYFLTALGVNNTLRVAPLIHTRNHRKDPATIVEVQTGSQLVARQMASLLSVSYSSLESPFISGEAKSPLSASDSSLCPPCKSEESSPEVSFFTGGRKLGRGLRGS